MLKIKRGFTLIEVIVSIALLGILAVAFLPSIANHFQWLVDTKTDITQNAFEIQDDMENRIQEVIEAMSGGSIAEADWIGLDITDKIDVELFVDEFSSYTDRVYPSAYQVEVSDGANKKFVTLVGDKRLPELPVPVINTVSRAFIKNGAESNTKHEYYDYANLKIVAKSNMISNPQNSFNRYRSDWYVSKPGFNIPLQSIENIDQDNDFGRIYPEFPDDYIAVPILSELGSAYSYISATQRNISVELSNDIVNSNSGRHILYTITPFAKSLKKGNTSSLLPIYVYGPDVTTNLALHLDASTINMSDKYNASTNSNGTMIFADGDAGTKDDDLYYIRRWKNSRPSVETESTNSYYALQTTQTYMPVLVKDSVSLKQEIPFQSVDVEGVTVYSVWCRALGNKEGATTNANMAISSINSNVGNNWNMFVVMRKVDAPRAPSAGPIIKNNSGNSWSLGWTTDGTDYWLQLNAQLNHIELPTSIYSGEWLLVQAGATSSTISLKAKSLKKDALYSEAVSGTGAIDINDINITFNGVEISEILLYNTNMSSEDLGKIEEYLTNKYNPD